MPGPIEEFIKDFPYLGYVLFVGLVVGGLVRWLAQTSTQFDILKSKLYLPLTRRLMFKRLEKAAIKTDIQGNANVVINELRKELPDGWIRPISIKWVNKEKPESFIEDNKMVIRMRPLKNANHNFISTVYFYTRESLFPLSKKIIPSTQREATVLYFSRRIIADRKKDAVKVFENEILEPSIQKTKGILDYLDRFKSIDERGFFTGILIREIEEIAVRSRFIRARNDLGSEFSSILQHLEEFAKQLEKEGDSLPDANWVKKGPICSYALILVARPTITEPRVYINRARQRVDEGVTHIYVFGKSSQVSFAKQVIKAIDKVVPTLVLKERYRLYHDYRSNSGGIGALFELEASRKS